MAFPECKMHNRRKILQLICVITSELITLYLSVIAIFLNNSLADRHYCAQRNFASTFVPLILFYNWLQLVRTHQKLHHI